MKRFCSDQLDNGNINILCGNIVEIEIIEIIIMIILYVPVQHHEEYLGAVDMTSHVGTIPTGLAAYLLVQSSTALRLLPGE